ncbi:MAG: hypothetical protein J6V68_01975 [Clostridia bacterium]|nr:hypothetical protein [Clostridia bacterium]
MKKFTRALLLASLLFLIIFSQSNYLTAYANQNYLYLSGEVCGFDIITEGVTVIGLNDVVTKEKTYSPAKDAGIKKGDVLTKINNIKISSETNISSLLDGNVVVIEGKRNSNTVNFIFYPALDINGDYRLGLFLKNDITGLGTITYYDDFGNFGALGHDVFSNNENLTTYGGIACDCKLTSIIKPQDKKPGELRGFLNRNNKYGTIKCSKITGLYGKYDNLDKKSYKKIKIASDNEVKIGSAYAYTNVSGESKYYKISIIKVDANQNIKNLVIKIEDEELLNLTGGIVQGMSGTPIIQNEKIIGAITHVFINDSTRGYGILISNMLENN